MNFDFIMRHRPVVLMSALLLLFFAASTSAQSSATKPAKRPNIVLILADDLGFTDTSPYGSEISTPNIAALAAEGIRFTNYHTAASCAPTRAMLLTGVDSHRNGVPNIPESLPSEQKQHAHYQGVLSDNVVTVATLLRDAGYHTYMSGKWHLGKTPQLLPISRGFERTLTMTDTGADNWEQKPYLPVFEQDIWFADGQPHTLPEDFYSSKYLVDKAIEFIESNRQDGQPFFSYIPFQAVHIPVQAPREYTEKYLGKYDSGWTAMREQRRLAAEKLGIIPAQTKSVITPGTLDWNSLTAEERKYQSKRMAVYAGMVDAMDNHIGRFVQYLKDIGQYDNTIFIFTSDNGPEGSDPQAMSSDFNFNAMMYLSDYNTDYETLGEKGNFSVIGASNATIAASPLAFYKFYAGEGGMRVPLIISGSGINSRGSINRALTYVTDITPTILNYAGVVNHEGVYAGRNIEPIIGKDLYPLTHLGASSLRTADEAIGYELGGNRALFKGDYKIVFNRGVLGDSQWHLFNIATDPGESNDLSESHKELLTELLSDYEQYEKNNNVLPVPENYSQVKQAMINGIINIYGTRIVIAIVVLFGFVVLIIRWFRRRS